MIKCPICEGKGKLKGFYPDKPADEWIDCRACWGTGIVNDGAMKVVPAPYPVPQPYPVYPAPVRITPRIDWRYRPGQIWYGDPMRITSGSVTAIGESGTTVVYSSSQTND